jgi:hypothetical protein
VGLTVEFFIKIFITKKKMENVRGPLSGFHIGSNYVRIPSFLTQNPIFIEKPVKNPAKLKPLKIQKITIQYVPQ